jgi:hypothetical protein
LLIPRHMREQLGLGTKLCWVAKTISEKERV